MIKEDSGSNSVVGFQMWTFVNAHADYYKMKISCIIFNLA
ncbi:hypothetical protein Halha_1745 [Halobacteroides halobius DSM 5150]|uniref:Uncharacterized protein n=1 Tax=Halobacteroides halobius (strain ATCC 35273 / DSM 5150 / MD-1) TaxID=748449 RepID=L0K8R9_HALHC|nr:hypothetical protein Halha_1745 [Halobacteroides halobius DSM 5150]